MRSSAQRITVPVRRHAPTRSLKQRYSRDLAEALAELFPAGRRVAIDDRGHHRIVDVFVTRERRAGRQITCGVRITIGAAVFVLDDGADEFARSQLCGPPVFDEHGNVAITAVVRLLDEEPRESSLWVAADLSALAIADELVYFR
jgi:hypothetical protein